MLQVQWTPAILSTCRGGSAMLAFYHILCQDLGPQIWGLVHATRRDGPPQQV